MVPLAGHNNLIETDSLTIIDDCYNANPASTKASLDVLAKADTRQIAVLGDMLNWGRQKNRCTMRSENMLPALESIYLSASDSSQNIWQPVQVNSVPKHRYFILKQKMTFRTGRPYFKSKDTVLVKASNGMKFSEIVSVLKEVTYGLPDARS